jgi:hypothetical protein
VMVLTQVQNGRNMAWMMANLSARQSFVLSVDLVFFSPFTQIVNRVDAVDTPSTMSNLLFFGFDAKKRIDFVLIIDDKPVALLQ